MDLTQAMHAATQDPPPTAIDVDRLITGERRRTRRLRVVTGAAVAAALALGVTAAPRFLAQQPTGLSPGTPVATAPPRCGTTPPAVSVTVGPSAGRVVEICEEAIGQLNAALTDALHVALPDVTGGTLYFERDGGYIATFGLPGGGSLMVRLEPAEIRSAADSAAFADKHCPAGCRRETREGTMLLVRSATEVWAVRPNGTVVRATVTGPVPVTEQQLIDLVMAPGLTLFP